MIKLLPHQEIGRDFLIAKRRALLADEMRVGKSVQTIAAADTLEQANILIVCPASVREQWRRQFKQFGVRQPRLLQVISYEQATKYKAAGSTRHDLVVFDESHYLKNRKSKRTKACFDEIAKNADRVWCLSGTPSPNNASELWPMLHALFPETIDRGDGKPMNYWQFTKRFCKVVTTPFGEKIEGNRNTDELRQRMAPIMLRRPRTIMGKVRLPSEPLYLDVAKAELKRLEQELRDELGAQFNIAPQLMDDKVKARLGRLTGLAKVPSLVARLKDEFESGLDKVVLFAWHTDVIDKLTDELSGYYPCVVDGSTAPDHRQERVDLFTKNERNRVFIGQIKAAGEGLDLSAACETIFVETFWVPGVNDQAAERINGYNQTRPTRVRYAVIPGSIDERLMEVNTRKMKDIQELLD